MAISELFTIFKTMSIVKKIMFLSALIATGFLISCNKHTVEGTSFLEVRLTDAPGPYDSVFVQVIGVSVHTDAGGWQQLAADSGYYDLLTLQNGVDTLLAASQIVPSGRISQVRLILGDSNRVVVAGMSYPLSLSSQDETGLKCNLDTVLPAGSTARLLLDFDADQSVLQQGNGSYRLKPVVSASFQ
ncbi:MAG: hypothetical protein RL021_1332 [Bacteroidota bacterium]|jgi:hypothetical protein